MDKIQIEVFGKPGCGKCAMLNRRIDELLTKEPYASHYEKVYNSLGTEEGLVKFALAQCINPNRIPSMVLAKNGEYIENPTPEVPDPVCKASKLYDYIGIQTDYSSDGGKGVITPAMIQSILDQGLAL